MTIFDLVHPDNSEIVNKYLAVIGIDCEYPIIVQTVLHRTLQNTARVGYLFAGEIQHNRAFINSPWCDTMDRLIVSGQSDMSLARTLMEMNGTYVSYDTIHSYDENQNKEIQNILEHYMDEEESAKVEEEIKVLDDILFQIRGDQRLKSGAYKLPHQYFEEEEYVKPRKKKEKVKKFKPEQSN